MTYEARWSKTEYGYGKEMRYFFYNKADQMRKAKRDALKDGANYLDFDGEFFERHGSRWYKLW